MKTRGSFSQKKFQSLTPEAQTKALDKLLSCLDEALATGQETDGLRAQIIAGVSWMGALVPDHAFRLAEDLAAATSIPTTEQAIARFKATLGKSFKDTQLHLRQKDGPRFANPESLARAAQVILILDNLRSAFNVGSIFRSAECLGIKAVWLCGVCPTPHNAALANTARGTQQRVAWSYFEATELAVEAAKASGYRVYALETAPEAESAYTCNFQPPLALVLGNESLGIGDSVLQLCDTIVALPVQGWKNSLNVAVACAVCAYQIVFGRPVQRNVHGTTRLL